jgi:hypothetical protein
MFKALGRALSGKHPTQLQYRFYLKAAIPEVDHAKSPKYTLEVVRVGHGKGHVQTTAAVRTYAHAHGGTLVDMNHPEATPYLCLEAIPLWLDPFPPPRVRCRGCGCRRKRMARAWWTGRDLSMMCSPCTRRMRLPCTIQRRWCSHSTSRCFASHPTDRAEMPRAPLS